MVTSLMKDFLCSIAFPQDEFKLYLDSLFLLLSKLFNIDNISNVDAEFFLKKVRAYATEKEIEIFLSDINLMLSESTTSGIINQCLENINLLLMKWCKNKEADIMLTLSEKQLYNLFFEGKYEPLKSFTKKYPRAFNISSIQWKRKNKETVITDSYKTKEVTRDKHFFMDEVSNDKRKIINLELEKMIIIDNERSIIARENLSLGKIKPEILLFVSMITTIIMLILVIFVL